MAAQIPPKLKSADIQRFALRASQLEKAKPAIAYWCEYWIVNQLLAKGLHSIDAACLQYTTTLMDKLEQTKTQYASDDAIVDDTAGQAYVENFGLETFERADRAVRADKVTKQTADTFLAASTFLELLNIWGEPSPEIHAKIRYAKWNAVRIAKALKEGKDPNESNPKPEPTPEDDLEPLDPNDPEVRQLTGESTKPQQASVEEVPDKEDRFESRLAAQSFLDQSLHPSKEPSAGTSPGAEEKFDPYPRSGFPYNIARENDVSPMEPEPTEPKNERHGSVGGGYFPEIPTFTSDSRPPTLPTAPPENVSPLDPPYPSHLQTGPSAAREFDSIPPPIPDHGRSTPPQNFYTSPPPQHPFPRQVPTAAFASALIPSTASAPIHPPAPAPAQLKRQNYNTDDVAVAKAQKHARFAISALTFDDVNTAVKELRAALQTLGA